MPTDVPYTAVIVDLTRIVSLANDALGNSKEALEESLMAVLDFKGAEGCFSDEDMDTITGYFPESELDEEAREGLIESIKGLLGEDVEIKFEQIEPTNWNAKWEASYPPIFVGTEIAVIAPFHERPENVPFVIVIEPKMSFGTAHHPTTRLMLQAMKNYPPQERSRVVDLGTGTGVLGLFALRLGAGYADGFDTDSWSVENATENAARNDASGFRVWLGSVRDVPERNLGRYTQVYANINRNILLDEMPLYAACLVPDGLLFLSGYRDVDREVVHQRAEDVGFVLIETFAEGEWHSSVHQLRALS